MRYCENCGATLSSKSKFCPECGSPCEIREEGKKTIAGENCMSRLKANDSFSSEYNQHYSALKEAHSNFARNEIGEATPNANSNRRPYALSSINYICLALLIFGIFLCAFAPFAAINYLTIGNQPTVFQLVMDDVAHWGDITDSTAYWAAVTSLFGMTVCFILTIAKKIKAVRAVAALVELPLFYLMLQMIDLSDSMAELINILGTGFWSIVLLFFS